MRKLVTIFLFATACVAGACSNSSSRPEKSEDFSDVKIISVNGSTTEVLCALGFEKNIIGVDVTSTYPDAMSALPKVGHNRNLSAEAILSLHPQLVVGIDEHLNQDLITQLKAAHITVWTFPLSYSVAGTTQLIQRLADSLRVGDKAASVIENLNNELATKVRPDPAPKVLFLYARGAGTLMVSGNNTAAASMIALAGGVNAVTGFDDFKPLTPESLTEANPDIILMFSSGMESLGGMDGLLNIPGVAQTNAGKRRKVIEMDGQLLTGFGPRLGKAVSILSKSFDEANR